MRWRYLLWFNVALLLGLFFLRGRLLNMKEEVPLPVLGQLEAFVLTDQEGRQITRDTLMGKVWVANFMFSRCPSQCPTMNFKMSALQKTLPKEIHFASFSVDPEYDTPKILLEYSKRFSAESGRWLFLTGKKEQVDLVLKAAHFGESGEPSMHSLRFVLIDKAGAVRGYYNSEEDEPIANLTKDIRNL